MQETVQDIRARWGFKPLYAKLLTWPIESAKFKKGELPILGWSGLPHRLVTPRVTMCSNSTPQCRMYCINHAGRGMQQTVQRGRGWKTELLIEQPSVWFTMFWHELELARKRYDQFLCRPNVFTDVSWERVLPDEFWQHFADVRFHDYTKQWDRAVFPPNYKVVFSASEITSDAYMKLKLRSGFNVSVVFDLHKSQPMPSEWHGMPLVDGDVDDNLWARPPGHLIGLRAKGKLRSSDSPFKRSFDDDPDKKGKA